MPSDNNHKDFQVLTIIPARGGSKGIPRKNVQYIAGQPMIAWNIQAASQSKWVNRIVVSTDDSEISMIASAFGANVVNRPAEISGDAASSESALIHVLDHLKQTESYQPDLVVFMQCTSPLTSSEDIDNCIQKLMDEQADSALTVADFHYFVWKIQGDGLAEGMNHDKAFRLRRQDREPQFLETGAVYVMRTEGFLNAKHRFFGKTVASEMPLERVFEIDDPVDLIVADTRLRAMNQKRLSQLLPLAIKAIVFDFDGVMTNNQVLVSQDGSESVLCSRSDGMGISQLKSAGYCMAVLSTEVNPVVAARCQKLNLECHQSLGNNKALSFKEWAEKKGLSMQNIIFVGNDINDMECMKLAGCSVVPADAHVSVMPYAKIILSANGGFGAVRELTDLIQYRSKFK